MSADPIDALETLDSISRVAEALRFRELAAAEVAAARRRRDALQTQQCSEIKVRADRRCGEMLRAMAAAGERAPPGGTDGVPTLDELGIKKGQAYRFQKLASIPIDLFNAAIASANAVHGEATTHRILESAVTGSRQGGARAVADRSLERSTERPFTHRPAGAAELVEMLADPATRAELADAWVAFSTHLDRLRGVWRDRESSRLNTGGPGK